MKYVQVDIELDKEKIEEVSGFLIMRGIDNLAIEDPSDLEDILNKKEGYEWDYIDDSVLEMKNGKAKVTFYLDDNKENRALAFKTVIDMGEEIKGIKTSVNVNDDSEWKDNWKQYFKPKKVGKRIVVKPTWEEYEKSGDDIVIEIDPGMAFGTGTHETTSLCLKLMEDYMKAGDKVLDVGSGSGILSIAGAYLGAEDVLAIDIDPEAVRVTGENVALNNCQNIVTVRQGDLVKGVDYKANVVCANLMADLVILLTEHVRKHITDDGLYISSGILVEKEKLVAGEIEKNGFEIVEIREDGMWCAILAKPKA